MTAYLKDKGIKLLTYINPFFANVTNLPHRLNYFEIGDKQGYFIKDTNNKTFLAKSLSIEFATLDLTNQKARDWIKSIIKDNLIEEANSSGYMADFGEYLPLYGINIYDGSSPDWYHNHYPIEWSKINYEILNEQKNSETDLLYFMRSGFSTSTRYASLFWQGDQLASWDGYDGLQSVLYSHFNGGITGNSITHSDIGGYNIVPKFNYNRT